MSDAECFQWIVDNNAQVMREPTMTWVRLDGTKFQCNFTLASGNTQWGPAETLKEAIEQAAKHQADHC